MQRASEYGEQDAKVGSAGPGNGSLGEGLDYSYLAGDASVEKNGDNDGETGQDKN